jgi:hypothetical protein
LLNLWGIDAVMREMKEGVVGAFENSFLARQSTIIGARSSRLHEICGLNCLEKL